MNTFSEDTPTGKALIIELESLFPFPQSKQTDQMEAIEQAEERFKELERLFIQRKRLLQLIEFFRAEQSRKVTMGGVSRSDFSNILGDEVVKKIETDATNALISELEAKLESLTVEILSL